VSAGILARIVEREANKLEKKGLPEEQLAIPDLERLEILSRCIKLLRNPVPGKHSEDPDDEETDEELLERAGG
jgi:hypothetical protein